MNHVRILRATNGLLMMIGYQLHYYDYKTQRYRLSLWIVGNFILTSAFYLIAFTHHFEQSALLYLMQDVSPFLKKLIRIQLLMGLKIYLFGIYDQSKVTRALNRLVAILPKVFAKKFSRKEAYAYFLNYSTLLISLAITFYIAYEMSFEIPPLDNILIFCGLLIPHFVLGGALKLYNVGIWLLREQLLDLQAEFQRIVEVEENVDKTLVMLEGAHESNQLQANKMQDFSLPLQELYKQLSKLSETTLVFTAALHRQILLLIILNCNCLLAGTYMRVFYESSWYVLFMTRTRHVFQATNYGMFILILWDYFTLYLTQSLFENVKQSVTKNIYKAVKQRQRFTESTRDILTDMHDLLKGGFNSKLLGIVQPNLRSFLMLHIFVGIIIALIVVYHYLEEQILALFESFDSLNAEDD